jgi:hypothetical protein
MPIGTIWNYFIPIALSQTLNNLFKTVRILCWGWWMSNPHIWIDLLISPSLNMETIKAITKSSHKTSNYLYLLRFNLGPQFSLITNNRLLIWQMKMIYLLKFAIPLIKWSTNAKNWSMLSKIMIKPRRNITIVRKEEMQSFMLWFQFYLCYSLLLFLFKEEGLKSKSRRASNTGSMSLWTHIIICDI